ncbi:MAG: hypothetical protein HOE58_03400 [Porticoccaceae bacterium]|nr:hypothetical protein [Porticoccaceae bacterium]
MSDAKIIKGKRPHFYETDGVDQLMHMVMVLAQENSAMRDRLDTLEKVCAASGVIAEDACETYQPDQATLETRETRRQASLSMLFSVMSQQAAELKSGDSKQRFKEVIEEIAAGSIDQD